MTFTKSTPFFVYHIIFDYARTSLTWKKEEIISTFIIVIYLTLFLSILLFTRTNHESDYLLLKCLRTTTILRYDPMNLPSLLILTTLILPLLQSIWAILPCCSIGCWDNHNRLISTSRSFVIIACNQGQLDESYPITSYVEDLIKYKYNFNSMASNIPRSSTFCPYDYSTFFLYWPIE